MNYDNENDDVRLPDKVVREQLLPSTTRPYGCDYDEDEMNIFNTYNNTYNNTEEMEIDNTLSQAIHESYLLQKQQEEYEEYEQDIIRGYYIEQETRQKQFGDLVSVLFRLSKYDAHAKNIYEIVSQSIYKYCEQTMDHILLNRQQYDDIFHFLKQVRTSPQNIEHLKRVILREDE